MFVAGEEDRGLQAFVQYAYPAEGGSQIAFAERPGLAGYGGCVTVTLRYDRKAGRATGYFEVDKDAGVTNIATLTQLSPKLGSRPKSERKFVNPYIGTDVFAGVVGAAGFDAGAGKSATEWCFTKFRVWTLGARKAKDVFGSCPARLQLSGCCSPRCEPCEGEPNKLAGTKSAAGGAVAFSPLRQVSVRGGKCGPRDKAGALTGFTFMDLHRRVKDDDFAKYYDPAALELTGSGRLCVDAAPPYAPGPGGGLVKNALLVGLPPVTRQDLLTASVDLCDLQVRFFFVFPVAVPPGVARRSQARRASAGTTATVGPRTDGLTRRAAPRRRRCPRRGGASTGRWCSGPTAGTAPSRSPSSRCARPPHLTG